jgi:hypothetical protein
MGGLAGDDVDFSYARTPVTGVCSVAADAGSRWWG